MQKKENSHIQEENAEVICRKIKDDVEREVNEIIAAARKEADVIRIAAENEVTKKKDDLLKNFHKESQALKEKIFSTVAIEKKRIILDEKNKFIEEVFAQIKEEAHAFRMRSEYIRFLTAAILDGALTVDAENIDVLYSSLDDKIITEDFKRDIEAQCRTQLNRAVTLQVHKSDFTDIGVIVQSHDGHCMCDNRFLARFALRREEFYMSLLREVF
ncbi:MAG: V-type ATP synthase subunit E family protein [Candidatus Omnitrophica bacterium]|nr:V-type ATP synthase subunit E family protein [Candidatus Omnitrophota bacterium]